MHFTEDLQRALAGAESVELKAVQACLLDAYIDANEDALRPADEYLGEDAMTKVLAAETSKGFARGLNQAINLIQDAMAPRSEEESPDE